MNTVHLILLFIKKYLTNEFYDILKVLREIVSFNRIKLLLTKFFKMVYNHIFMHRVIINLMVSS